MRIVPVTRSPLARTLRLAAAAAWLLHAVAPGPLARAAGDLGDRTELLTIGLTKSAFVSVNRNDMEAALKTLAQTVGRKQGYRIEARTQFFAEPADFARAVKAGEVRLAIMDSWTYLAMDPPSLGATPNFVSVDGASVGKRYLLLTRKDSGLSSLPQLRGKTLTTLEVVNGSLGRPWLATLLARHHFGSPEQFFGSSQTVAKPSAAVLPVFFRRADVCLVDANAFAVMSDMNPQVGRELQTIEASESLVDGLQLTTDQAWVGSETVRADLLKTMSELHREPAGQQLLMLFKTDRLLPFSPSHLDAVRKLWDMSVAESHPSLP